MSDPDLSSLRLFATICQERNLARVAQQLHVTPSAISKRLAKLEADLNSPPLLKRGRYGVVPTEAGLDLLSRSRSLLDEADALREGLQRFSNQGGRTVRVLTSSTLMSIARRIWLCGRIGIHALHLALSRRLTEIGEATPKARRGGLRHQNLGA
jgi:DNA-binding transcriptional LysR family regulator